MNSVVVHYNELALKGKNRPWFLGKLVRNLRGAVADLDPVQLGLPEGFAGRIAGRLSTTAVWHDDAPDVFESMTAQFTLDVGRSHFARVDFDRGQLVGRWAAGEFTADTLMLEGSGLRVTGQGRLGVLHGSSQATYAFTADDVIVLEPWTDRRAHGAARGGGGLGRKRAGLGRSRGDRGQTGAGHVQSRGPDHNHGHRDNRGAVRDRSRGRRGSRGGGLGRIGSRCARGNAPRGLHV